MQAHAQQAAPAQSKTQTPEQAKLDTFLSGGTNLTPFGINTPGALNTARLNLAYIWLQSNYGVNATSGDRPWRMGLELKYRLSDSLRVALGAELVDWDLNSSATNAFLSGTPSQHWFNVGLGYNLNDMARLSFLWQFSDSALVKNANGMPMSTFGYPAPNSKSSGNLLSTQLTIKF